LAFIIPLVEPWLIILLVAVPLGAYLVAMLVSLRSVRDKPLTALDLEQALKRAREENRPSVASTAPAAEQADPAPYSEPPGGASPGHPSRPPPLPPGAPGFTYDYRGRLWVQKKNRGFFRRLRQPKLPPDEP
jgi:hypothetical protein